ncbi:MAG: hypothetical protein ACI909_003022 [Planctomycetota bacterium]|jgi:hypothetical protein
MNVWLETAMRPEVFKRSWRVAILIGTILIGINYFDRVLAGSLLTMDYFKMMLTYCVPFCVSTHASVSAIMEQQRTTKNE